MGRKRSIVLVKPPIAFLPGFGSLTLELFTKMLTNERMRIEISGIVWIFSCKNFALLNLARIVRQSAGLSSASDSVRPWITGGLGVLPSPFVGGTIK